MEELQRFLAIDNVAHVPLGTTPEFWQTSYGPLEDRRMKMCFLGNNHVEANWLEGHTPETIEWAGARREAEAVESRPFDRRLHRAGRRAGRIARELARKPYELAPTLKEEFQRWNILGGMLLRDCRNTIVKAAAETLRDDFVIVGKGWERLGLRAAQGARRRPRLERVLRQQPGVAEPLRRLRAWRDAATARTKSQCSGGLLFTQYNRELPELFEPGKECVAFRNVDEMLAAWEKIQPAPSEFDAVVEAGKRRVIAEHTWEHRMARILDLAKERFDLPW